MKTYRGETNDAAGQRYAIAVSRYNDTITNNLLDGAVRTLKAAGVADDAIDVAWAPGAFELPLIADRLASTGKYAAVLCLGAVIRGDTSHDQHINRAVSLGLTETGLRHGLPVLFGVLTCDTFEQAIQRAGGTVTSQEPKTGLGFAPAAPGKPLVGNKGVECAEAALEMVSLVNQLNANDE
jgi:6,7-dimethyl-8-ribityllumazine synthase